MKQKERELENNVYFWQKLDTLYLSSQFYLDRPLGTAHREFTNLVYPVDYGYLKDTFSDDMAPIYCYMRTAKEKDIKAIIVSAAILKKDSVAKLLIGCTEDETKLILKFINSTEFQKAILIRRGNETPVWASSE